MTDRDRQRQTETDRDRQRQTETDRDRQRQTEQRQTETDRDRQRQTETYLFWCKGTQNKKCYYFFLQLTWLRVRLG